VVKAAAAAAKGHDSSALGIVAVTAAPAQGQRR